MSRNAMIFRHALALRFRPLALAADASAFSNSTAFSTGKAIARHRRHLERRRAARSRASLRSLLAGVDLGRQPVLDLDVAERGGLKLTDAAAAAKFNSIGSMSLLENGSKLNAFRAK